MVSSVVFVIQICLIQYAFSQPSNVPTMTNIGQVGTNARNTPLEGLLPRLEPSLVIETSTKVPVACTLLPTLEPGPVSTSTKNLGISKTPMPRTPSTEARNAQLEGILPILELGPVIDTAKKIPGVSNLSPILESGPVISTSTKNLRMPKNAMPRTPSTEARNIQLGDEITSQGSGLVKDTLAKVPGVPKTPINPYKPLLANNNAFMNPSMANIGLGIGVSRQAVNGARNVQVKGHLPILEHGPVIETSTKVPVVPIQHNTYGSHIVPNSNDFMLTNLGISKTVIPRTSSNGARNVQVKGQLPILEPGSVIETSTKVPVVPIQHNTYSSHMVPNSNDFMLTNLGISKTVIPRTSTNGARNIQVEGQITSQASDTVKDTLAKVPEVPNNPYKSLMANNNAFMSPSMANIDLGIGVSRQASNGAGMPMPSQKFNGAGMPKVAQGQWSGTGAVAGVSDELPMMWQNVRKTSRTNNW